MMRRCWTLAGMLILAGGTQLAQGDDTVRLGTKVSDSKATTLSYDGHSDTLLTRGVRGGGGFYGGYRGGYRGGYGVGYRGYGYGGYGYGGYGYGGYGWGGYYGGYYAPVYYPRVYVAPVYYYTPTYYYPVSGTVAGGTPVNTLRPVYVAPSQDQLPQGSAQPSGNGTFPYDGGPTNPIPLPKNGEDQPMYQPVPKLPAGDGRLVYIPSAPQTPAATGSSGFAYPAYGDSQPSTFGSDRTAVKKK